MNQRWIMVLLALMWGCKDGKKAEDAGVDAGTDQASEQETGSEAKPDYPSDEEGDTTTASEQVDAGSLECFQTEPCGDPIPYERQICPYPLTPELDGNLDDEAWSYGYWEQITSEMGTVPAADDSDASFEFACVADDDFIYIAFRVTDDTLITGETTGCDVYKDDSIEFYIDGCAERASDYDGDDAQIVIGAETAGVTEQSEMALGGCHTFGPDSGTRVRTELTDNGWVGEVAIPLDPDGDDGWAIERAHGQIIGFNTHYNDDDLGGDGQNSKLIWGLKDRESDNSWNNPQNFNELQFCSIYGPDTGTGSEVEPDGGVDTGTDGDTSVDTGTGDDTADDTGTQTAVDTATETEAAQDTVTMPDGDAGDDAGDDTGLDTATATEDVPDTETNTDLVPDAGDDTETATDQPTDTPDAGSDTATATASPDAGSEA